MYLLPMTEEFSNHAIKKVHNIKTESEKNENRSKITKNHQSKQRKTKQINIEILAKIVIKHRKEEATSPDGNWSAIAL